MSRPPNAASIVRRFVPGAAPKRCRYELVIDGVARYEHDSRAPLEAKRRLHGGEIREVGRCKHPVYAGYDDAQWCVSCGAIRRTLHERADETIRLFWSRWRLPEYRLVKPPKRKRGGR